MENSRPHEFNNLKEFMLRIENDPNFPNVYFYGILEDLVPMQEVRDYLFNQNVFVKVGKFKGQDTYTLGATGVTICQGWRQQQMQESGNKINKRIEKLTVAMYILGGATWWIALWAFIYTVLQYYK